MVDQGIVKLVKVRTWCGEDLPVEVDVPHMKGLSWAAQTSIGGDSSSPSLQTTVIIRVLRNSRALATLRTYDWLHLKNFGRMDGKFPFVT